MEKKTFFCVGGHESTDADHCSHCGKAIQASAPELAPVQTAADNKNPKFESCPKCSSERADDSARYCGRCRYDFINKTTPAEAMMKRRPRPLVGLPPEVETPPEVEAASEPTIDEELTMMPEVAVVPAIEEVAPAPVPVAEVQMPEIAEPPTHVPVPEIQVVADAEAPALPPAADQVVVTPQPVPIVWQLLIEVDARLRGDEHKDDAPANLPARTIKVDADLLIVGRTDVKRKFNPQLALDYDDFVSRQHAILSFNRQGRLTVTDVGSSNGTEVNGRPLRAAATHVLSDGDQVTIGRFTRITVRCS